MKNPTNRIAVIVILGALAYTALIWWLAKTSDTARNEWSPIHGKHIPPELPAEGE